MEILEYSQVIIKAPVDSYTWNRRFISLFGVSKDVFLSLQSLLPTVPFKHLYWALFWLKNYPTETLAAVFFNISEKTYREKVFAVVESVYALNLIHWNDRYVNWSYMVPCCSIDGTDCFINEHHPFDRSYGSHKLKHAALRYEIALALGCSKILWWNGGVPAGANPDIVLARSGFINILQGGEKALADKGYSDGQRHFHTPIPNAITPAAKLFNKQHKQIMARHENVNKRIKQFDILRSWRHKEDAKHKICFGAIVNITQICLDFEPLPDLILTQ